MGTILPRNMKALCVLFLIILVLCGCDVYAGKRPSAYPNSVWLCEEEKIAILINADGTAYLSLGSIITFSEDPEYLVEFDYADNIFIVCSTTDETVMTGACIFSSQKLTVTIGTDNLFGGKYHLKELIFCRQDQL